jgi:flavin-dependent dehydrogenase
MAGGCTYPARWIIGADGSGSRVRKWSGLDERNHDTRRFAFRRHFRVTPWSSFMEVYWGSEMQAYVTPLGADEVCVAVTSLDPHVRLEAIAQEFPGLAARLRDALPTSTERGATTGMRRLRRVYRENVVLIGDASGSTDAITGEGLSLAFQQSLRLADALESGDLARYQADHEQIARRPRQFAQILLALGARPILRRHAIRALASDSRMFARLLSMHVGSVMPKQLAATGALFGWKLLESWGKEGLG